ncbi:glycoside hydrolase family 127 protein [Spirosoma arcticum]
MKPYCIAAFLIYLFPAFAAYSQPLAQPVDVSTGWKMQTGDNACYAETSFDDQSWKAIKVGSNWESQGLADYDGVAWYRTNVVLPSLLKISNSYLKGVLIRLGRINDNDRTFVNGTEIGHTVGQSVNRNYVIPFELIQWDQPNVIAVRVEDQSGNGGLTNGPYSIGGPVKLSTVVSLETADRPSFIRASSPTVLTKSVTLKSILPVVNLTGVLDIKVYNSLSKTVIFQQSHTIVLGQPSQQSIPYSVTVNGAGSYKADYRFRSQAVTDSLNYNTLLAYSAADRTNEQRREPVVAQKIPDKALAFAPETVRFSGFLEERLKANLTQRLLNIDENGILEGFYNRPGKQTWVGEYPGKYLHAASRVWRYSKNPQLKTQMDRIVDVLIATQLEDGYLGTYLPEKYWTAWDVWAHKYDLLGLLSYYAATGYKPALETSKNIGDLLCRTFGKSPGKLAIMKSGGHVGMASGSVLEPMTELYRFTGDTKYLDFCNYIVDAYETTENGPKLISTLTTLGKVDKTANAKAYEMMSNLVGIVKLYQLTGDAALLKAAETAWEDIAAHKLYITGTASHGEYFREDFDLPATNEVHMGEGCVTTTWLQLSQALHALTGEAKYVDEFEKSIYNHLFAAENPQTGCVSYYTALQGKKPYRCTIDAHCCLASIPRGFAIIPELMFTKNSDNGLSVNSYSAGGVQSNIRTNEGKEVGIKLRIDSAFPQEGQATITLTPDRRTAFAINLHVPEWSRNFKAVINGKSFAGTPGQYLTLLQVWDKKSIIQVSFDLNTQLLDGGKSYPGFVALKNGPQVLALDHALNPQINDFENVSINSATLTTLPKALLPKGWVGSQVYSARGMVAGKPVDLMLVPFAEAGQTGADLAVWLKKGDQ